MTKEIISDFFSNLHEEEIKIVSSYLETHISKSNSSRTMKLFRQMISGQYTPKKSNSAENKLKSRLLEMSLDAFLINGNMNSEVTNKWDSTTIKLNKQLIQCKLLQRAHTPSKLEIHKHLLNQIISEAREMEIYSVLSEALRWKKFFIGLRSDLKVYEKINKEQIHAERCLKSLESATDKYWRVILSNDLSKSIQNKKQKLQDYLSEIEKDYKETQSQQINYYLQIMKAAFFEECKDYNKAKECYLNLIVIMKKYKYTYRLERIGFVYNNLAFFNSLLGRHDEAIRSYKKAKSCFLPDTFHDLICTEQGFRTYFYSKKYAGASSCLSMLLAHPTSNSGRFRKSKFIYNKACLLFAQGQYKEAQVLLREPLEIEKDKTRWNISLRILNIMIFVELNKKNEAIRANEALRKFLERTRKIDELKPRDLLISKLLKEMEKSNFVFDEENSLATQLLSQLSDKNSEVAWEHYTSELIPFHEWVEGKRVKTDILKQMEYA